MNDRTWRIVAAAIVPVLLISAGGLLYFLWRDGDGGRAVMERKVLDIDGREITVTARVGEEYIQVLSGGKWTDLLVKGVNIGAAKPGHFPGESAITYEEYIRWLEWIGEMNCNCIRLYTHHPPHFYRALSEYNERHDDPILLLQGITMDETVLMHAGNAFNETVMADLALNIEMVVDIVHGNAIVPFRYGIASGTFDVDVADHVLAFVIGIEFDPATVRRTDSTYAGLSDYSGRFVRTGDGSPFEIWLATMLERCASYEFDMYSTLRPLSFVNWPTTDPLEHPYEPLEGEDYASIDPDAIQMTESLPTGLFCSYHVYPYYPDFMDHDPIYLSHTDSFGIKSSYAGYLSDLKRTHSTPIVIAEYGVPSSRGNAHGNVLGWDHGGHTENEQGLIDSTLFSEIATEGLAGGILFSWQDEWFKRVWNTMDYMDPGRRPFWRDVQSCEQHFGMLGFDPGPGGGIVLDGDVSDWMGARQLYATDERVIRTIGDGKDASRNILSVYADSDESFLYLRIDLGADHDPARSRILLLIDSVPGQGITSIPGADGTSSERGSEFIVQIGGEMDSRVLVDSHYDVNYYDYAVVEKVIPQKDYPQRADNGILHTVNLTINRGYRVELLDLTVPFTSYETGLLRWGTSDPSSPDQDTLADIIADEGNIEIRIPWLMLNVRDPSRMAVMGDLWTMGMDQSITVDGFYISALSIDPSDGTVTDSMPFPEGDTIPASGVALFSWEPWEHPTYLERLKGSYHIMKETYGRY